MVISHVVVLILHVNLMYYFFFVSRGKFSFKVSVYMLELYNDRLIDLLAENSAADVSFKYSSDLNSVYVYHMYYFYTT